MRKNQTYKMSPEIIELINQLAEEEMRSKANVIEYAVKVYSDNKKLKEKNEKSKL